MNKDNFSVAFVWLVVSGLIIGALIFFGTRHRAAETPPTPKVDVSDKSKRPCELPLSKEDYAKCFPDKTDKGA